MVWYESARLVHGRPLRFSGHYYDNVFVHFKPADRKWYGVDVMQVGDQMYNVKIKIYDLPLVPS